VVLERGQNGYSGVKEMVNNLYLLNCRLKFLNITSYYHYICPLLRKNLRNASAHAI